MLASNKWLLLLLLLNLSTAFGGSDSTSSTYTYDFRDFFEFSGEWQTETSFDRWDFDSNQFIDARDLLVMLGGRKITPPPQGLVLVDVPAGSFEMGRRDDGDDGSAGGEDELPRHTVTLSAYQIGKFEITVRQMVEWLNWAQQQGILEDSNGQPLTENSGSVYGYGENLVLLNRQFTFKDGVFSPIEVDGYTHLAEHAVVGVSWFGAAAFCNWLSLTEVRNPCYDLETWALVDPNGGGYRLPTEAEWERAAAWDGDKHWIYGFQSDELSGKDRANYYDESPDWVNPWGLSSPVKTSPVGWFNGRNVSPNGLIQTLDSASPVGCYDMSGNIGEWCEDWYQSDFYGTPEAVEQNPLCLNDESENRVIRGGSWTEGPARCRTAYRQAEGPSNTLERVGFRVVRNPAFTPLEHEKIIVPPSTFIMGRRDEGDDAASGNTDETPTHPVSLSAYAIGKYEITVEQYIEWMNWAWSLGLIERPTDRPVHVYGKPIVNPNTSMIFGVGKYHARTMGNGESLADHPVASVSWYGAAAFCNWMSLKEELPPCYDLTTWELVNPHGGGYRLPSEAEWERAAAWDGEKHWIYGFQSDELLGKNRSNYYDENPNWVDPLGNGENPRTSPVGWFNGQNISPNGEPATIDSPSPIGCYDMSGNIGEWCQDWYQSDFYATEAALLPNPVCANPGSGLRVVRGEGWAEGPARCRTAYRQIVDPEMTAVRLGFRVVQSLPLE